MTPDVTAGQQQMFAWIAALTKDMQASRHYPGLDALEPLTPEPDQVLICGMGGSAMAGGLLADGWPGLTVPVIVHRDSGLPAWAGPGTLVLVCSYSGDTEETLGALVEARRRGCRVVAVTSGGKLLAAARGAVGFPAVVIPGGQPPRTALGSSLGAQLHALARMGLLPDPTASIATAVREVAADHLVLPGNDAEAVGDTAACALADALRNRYVVIYTAGADAHGPGRRLLGQLNENAKTAGHVAVFPELSHNEIEGWNQPADRRDQFALVVLRGADESAEAIARIDTVLDLLRDQFAGVHQFHTHGTDHLSRLVGMIVFVDLVSAHLAVRRGVDPVPITRISALKSRLSGR